ncbi:TPA: tail fiber protein [Escherichia coli]|nr:tail fiber protein [Escherichia coli]HCG2936503.1 tail fiber protein [Escherichia coli]HCG2938959.1 tail fiber protein [Escherichia coli]HCG3099600.1 tail fiber protein [Escherichia coli]HCG3102308.1 tail fiber protein [Escherichia coli]
MATNNFKPFATAANANVTAQADWESLPALLSGFTAGKASSAQVNKAIRQASFIAAALAQYTANKSGLDVLDDGDLNGFIAKMSAAFGKDFQALDATLTALAGLTTGANKLPYFTGTDTASQTDLTSVGRDIIGKGTIADILTYLGLGEGSALPVGVPVPWPSATPPTGWLKCNGAPFSAEEYPKLAKAYPKLKLPDLRGEFIRGWDDGRGVDSARLLLSSQAASILEHNHEMHGWTGNPLMASDVYSSGSSVFAVQLSIGDGGLLYSWKDGSGTTNDSKRMDRTNHVSSGAGDGSPRNIAFNYIVRAA